MIQWQTLREYFTGMRGIHLTATEYQELARLTQTYFVALQQNGKMPTDIIFTDLTPPARFVIIDNTYSLWLEYNTFDTLTKPVEKSQTV